jgi:hypothetical protein
MCTAAWTWRFVRPAFVSWVHVLRTALTYQSLQCSRAKASHRAQDIQELLLRCALRLSVPAESMSSLAGRPLELASCRRQTASCCNAWVRLLKEVVAASVSSYAWLLAMCTPGRCDVGALGCGTIPPRHVSAHSSRLMQRVLLCRRSCLVQELHKSRPIAWLLSAKRCKSAKLPTGTATAPGPVRCELQCQRSLDLG